MDCDSLLNPQKELSPKVESAIDFMSWALPIVAAVCSIGSGAAALYGRDAWAAALGIAGGIIGALGVLFTNGASRIRDRRLAEARSLASLGVDMAQHAQNQLPGTFS
jgi:hypothetical protein